MLNTLLNRIALCSTNSPCSWQGQPSPYQKGLLLLLLLPLFNLDSLLALPYLCRPPSWPFHPILPSNIHCLLPSFSAEVTTVARSLVGGHQTGKTPLSSQSAFWNWELGMEGGRRKGKTKCGQTRTEPRPALYTLPLAISGGLFSRLFPGFQPMP